MWALGVCAIEMAERFPPRWKVNPNRVIFMIVRDPPPRLGDKEHWSLAFQDFVAQCLNKVCVRERGMGVGGCALTKAFSKVRGRLLWGWFLVGSVGLACKTHCSIVNCLAPLCCCHCAPLPV